jgi:hypothetical protein
MEYFYIVGSVVAIVVGTGCFAALQWPKLFTTAWRYQLGSPRRQHRCSDLCVSLIPASIWSGGTRNL